MKRSGFCTIKWQSNTKSVTGRNPSTMFGPNVKFGTNCPSMASIWIQSAPNFSTFLTSSPNVAKFALKIDGATFMFCLLYLLFSFIDWFSLVQFFIEIQIMVVSLLPNVS